MFSQKWWFQKKFGPNKIKDSKQFNAKSLVKIGASNSWYIIDLDKCPPGQMLPERISP